MQLPTLNKQFLWLNYYTAKHPFDCSYILKWSMEMYLCLTHIYYTHLFILPTHFEITNTDLNVCNFIHRHFEYGNCQLPVQLDGCVHGYTHWTGNDLIIWISGTRETISLLPPLILVSHLPCFKTDPNGIQTHDHSHTRWASYHMTTEEVLYTFIM